VDPSRREMVLLIDYIALRLIIAKGLNYLKLLETTLDNLGALQGFDIVNTKLRLFLYKRSYPKT
jgi:hypothetical protein